MKITYRVSEADYMDAHDLFAAHEPGFRRASRRALPWLGAVMILLPLVSLIRTPRNDTGLALITLLFGCYMLYCGFALRLYFRKLYRNERRFQHDSTAEISDDGIHVVTPDSDSRMKWSSFVRILESDRIFMLFSSQWMFNVFPKSAFGPGEMDAFRQLAHRNIAVRN
jgi:YcxB-like protein